MFIVGIILFLILLVLLFKRGGPKPPSEGEKVREKIEMARIAGHKVDVKEMSGETVKKCFMWSSGISFGITVLFAIYITNDPLWVFGCFALFAIALGFGFVQGIQESNEREALDEALNKQYEEK